MISWQTYYRPQKFSQLHLQQVSQQMQTLAQNGTLPQVLLFTGPKGTGKTSTARIIAAILNSKHNRKTIDYYYFQKQPTSTDYTFLDPDLQDPQIIQILNGNSYSVVEIDAASHRGIDDVRQLQEQVYLPPSLSQVTVYILDEVHMFTTEAFNALLKILEEPPAHAFFILATTEFHKIPATITSRCHLVNFTKATHAEIITALQNIIKQEKLKAEDEALNSIAELADGSFRDAVKLLQTIHHQGDITNQKVNELLIGNQNQQLHSLIQIILTKDQIKLIEFFAQLRQNNFDEKFFIKNLFQYLHQQLIANLKGEKNLTLTQAQATFLLQKMLSYQFNSQIPFLNLELIILEIICKKKKK